MAVKRDRAILVTGAAGRIGRAIVADLLGRGTTVVAVDIDAGALEVFDGQESVVPVCADVRDADGLDTAAARLSETIPHLNGIVAGAGGLVQPLTDWEGLTAEAWRDTVELNLHGHFNTVKAFVPFLLRADGPRSIVFLSSVLGLRGSGYMLGYSAAKAGQFGMVKGLAQDLATHQITVNAVAPSLTRESGRDQEANVYLEAAQAVPLGRIGTPEDVAGPVSFLVSEAARFITGQTIVVDGGQSAVAYWHPNW